MSNRFRMETMKTESEIDLHRAQERAQERAISFASRLRLQHPILLLREKAIKIFIRNGRARILVPFTLPLSLFVDTTEGRVGERVEIISKP